MTVDVIELPEGVWQKIHGFNDNDKVFVSIVWDPFIHPFDPMLPDSVEKINASYGIWTKINGVEWLGWGTMTSNALQIDGLGLCSYEQGQIWVHRPESKNLVIKVYSKWRQPNLQDMSDLKERYLDVQLTGIKKINSKGQILLSAMIYCEEHPIILTPQ